MENLENRIRRLEDLAEIEQLLNKYIYMLTTMDFDNFLMNAFLKHGMTYLFRLPTAAFILAGNISKTDSLPNLWVF